LAVTARLPPERWINAGLNSRDEPDPTTTTVRLTKVFFHFTGIDPEEFKEFVATGVSDEAVARWIEEKSKVRDAKRVLTWSR
jgi:hypothetical protein